ncbi:MAG: class I SAM-dependent methyltransferase [Myxococcaceae bacterium]
MSVGRPSQRSSILIEAVEHFGVPPYARELLGFQLAHEPFIRSMLARAFGLVGTRCSTQGLTAVDVGSGPGALARMLGERIGPGGRVVCIDNNPAFSKYVRELQRPHTGEARLHPVVSTGQASALRSDSADLVLFAFCCKGGFPDMPPAMREMKRTLKPGGVLAVMERRIDEVELPWGQTLAAEVDRATQTFFAGRAGFGRDGYFVPDHLQEVLRDFLGLVNCQAHHLPLKRMLHRTPENEAEALEHQGLASYLLTTNEFLRNLISPEKRDKFDRLTLHGLAPWFEGRPSFEVTYPYRLGLGCKPEVYLQDARVSWTARRGRDAWQD